MSERPLQTIKARWDGVAVFLSGACMLHCLVLPILVTLFPIIEGSLLEEQDFHVIMLFLILPTSLFALTVGCRRHRDLFTISLGATGLVILALTALFGHQWFGFLAERIVTTTGGLILASAHVRNYLLCRHADCDHDSPTLDSGHPFESQ